ASKKKKTAVPAPATPNSRNPLAATIESRWRRRGEVLSIERIASELGEVARYDIVAALKELEKAGAGEFFVGHAGRKSRFEWSNTPSSRADATVPKSRLKQRADTKRSAAEAERSMPVVPGAPAREQNERERGALEHRFYLRPGFVASIHLPLDVTPLEVERFCQFLQAIPFSRTRGE
ncbi:MAG TPA: hypothetical protein VMF89_33455, partial [Polyangiales bacterium]|nr:hypothetical protein [Polyangiales bacterium]